MASAARPRNGAAVADGRLGGAFRRIPVGAFKVGAVAATRALVLVTDPARDPKIRHPEWVRAEGIAGFAGLPLMSRGDLLGVLGVFVRSPLSPAAVDVLRIIANHAAAAIATARAFAEVETMRRRLALENQILRRSAETEPVVLVGRSAKLRAVLREITAVASTDATVLVLGESGTGKELAAQAIHQQSRRADGPFVEINCAAIPRELAESELFGHVRGAFSGATRDRLGRFEAAAGGTLFLDEIGELPLDLQGKLLRVLQEGTFERVGEVRTRHSDVRIVAATNRNLLAEVEAGRFRQDLYYRLAVYPITMPALRERREDIPELAEQLLDRICRRLARAPVALTPEQIAWLAARDWPGQRARAAQRPRARDHLVGRRRVALADRRRAGRGAGALRDRATAGGRRGPRARGPDVRRGGTHGPAAPATDPRRAPDATPGAREPAPRAGELRRQDLRPRRRGRAAGPEADDAGVTSQAPADPGSVTVRQPIRPPRPRATDYDTACGCEGDCAAVRWSRGSVNQNVEPRPMVLCTPIMPPIDSTRCLTIDRPRPVPPMSRVRPASTR